MLLGDAGEYLTGRQASDLLDMYLERLDSGQEMATPQCLVNSIGQTHKFKVKVTPYNFTAKRQIITATRVSVLQYPHLLILQGYTGNPHRSLRCT